MPTTPINIIDKRKAVKYTGSNSSDIDGLITQFDIISESGGVLTFQSTSLTWTANTNEWIIYTQGMVVNVVNQATFDVFYECVAICSDLAGASTPALRATGTAPVPLLLAGASSTVQVTMVPAMPDGTYTASSQLVGGVTLVGPLVIDSTTVVSTTRVDVVVRNTSLLSLGGAAVFVNGKD